MLLRCKKVISDPPDAEEESLRSPPLILVNGPLVWQCKGQTVNALNRDTGSLPLTRMRKGMNRYTKLCGFSGLAYQIHRNKRLCLTFVHTVP